MDYTRARKKVLDDELAALANRLKIGKSNLRLSSNLKSKEPTLQVVLDALKLTSFYKAFEITADVPEIYKSSGDMLKICPKLPGQIFKEPLLEEEIISFIRDLGHTGEIKFLSDVNINHMHQPWRSFVSIINKCLSGKTTALESLRLSRAQILWGMTKPTQASKGKIKLTPFYKAFEITADVPEIYMQELWVTVSRHHSLLRFKLNGKNLRHTDEMSTSITCINHADRLLPIIRTSCLNRKTTALKSSLSRAQFLGMIITNYLDYVYLLWEDLVYQVENKNSKKNNDMYNGFILHRHLTNQGLVGVKANKTYLLASATEAETMKAKPQIESDRTHSSNTTLSDKEDDDEVGLNDDDDDDDNDDDEDNDDDDDDDVDNQDNDDQEDDGQDDEDQDDVGHTEAYKTYLAYATGEKIPKPKYVKNKANSKSSPKKKTATTAKGKRLKTLAKAAKPAKKKQPVKTSKAKGLTMLSEVAITEAEQMKLAINRSLIETHSSHTSGSGADEGTGSKPGVLNVPTYGSDDEQISWKSSDKEDDDEVGLNDDDDDDDDNDDDEDNDDDDDDADNQDNDDQEDEDQDDVNEQTDLENDDDDFVHPKLSTQDKVRHNKEVSDEESDEEIQGANVEEEELDEEETNDEDEANELYRDVNVNLEGRDIEMTDAQQTNVQTTQVIKDTHVIITPVNPEGQQQSSSVSSGFVSNMLNPSPNTDFINKLDDNIKKIIKDQVKEQVKAQVCKILSKIKKSVNEKLEAKVLTRSSNESKTSHVVAANLSKLEPKKILIDKMESNKSIHKSDAQKNLYKALVDAYESDKLILDTYGETISFKRQPESTSAPKKKTSKTTGKSTKGSKSHHKSADESAQAEEPMQTAKDLEESAHQEFKTGVTEDQPDEETSQCNTPKLDRSGIWVRDGTS
ncbi:integrase, catalytic region, zinc finger, CCHC-type containing protein [Tanacetum coccineum]